MFDPTSQHDIESMTEPTGSRYFGPSVCREYFMTMHLAMPQCTRCITIYDTIGANENKAHMYAFVAVAASRCVTACVDEVQGQLC